MLSRGEDYRAATLDFAHDEADRREGRRITCPVLALWGRQGYLEEWYEVLGIWRGWTTRSEAGHWSAATTCRRRPRRRPTPSCASSSGRVRRPACRP